MRVDIDSKISGQSLPTAAIAQIFCEISDLLRPMLKAQQAMNDKMTLLIEAVEKGVTEAKAGQTKADEVIAKMHEDIEDRKASRIK